MMPIMSIGILEEHFRSCWVKMWSRIPLTHYHRCCCVR